jgi:processive 1,2-diacylglycerol beta-glucosyltransferase
MVDLVDKETGRSAGTLTDEQFELLESRLEKESPDDQDYWFDVASLDILEGEGADPVVMQVLRSALGERDEMELRWERR